MAGSSPQLLHFTHICLLSTGPKSGAASLMWSRNTSSREQLLHLTWYYSPGNAAPENICSLLQGHAASPWTVHLLRPLGDLGENSGKGGSADLVCLRTSQLCAVTQPVLFCNRPAFFLLILLLSIQQQKIALLSSTSLSTFNSRWALAFLT